jgi:ribosomal protein S18 acetylase RimI-like enzyme
VTGQQGVTIHEPAELTAGEIEQLADVLVGVVEAGASVGYLPPFDREEARAYWTGVIRPGNILLVAETNGAIVGTAQLELATRLNARQRAEVNKVLVRPDCQRQGIGRRLMEAIEAVACREGRTLLHLDTREGDGSNELYRRMGYVEAGTIPNWARSAAGTLDATVFYYKILDNELIS